MLKSYMYDCLNSSDLEQVGWADGATKSVTLNVINFEAARERQTEDIRRRISENRKSEEKIAKATDAHGTWKSATAGAD